MNRRLVAKGWLRALALSAAIAAGDVRAQPRQAARNRPTRTVVTNYHGWTNAVVLNNGVVEAVVVPDAGRVLQFRFWGSTDGPFWENRRLDGRAAVPTSWSIEGSFGGDKAWPSPQSDWGWPPPSGFDGSPNHVTVSNGVVILTTPVDKGYGIRTTRDIELEPGKPVMRIKTVFERVTASTNLEHPLGIWVITQLKDPVRCYVPMPQPSAFPDGYQQQGNGMPTDFRKSDWHISFTRDPAAGKSHKLGFDANALVWVGETFSLRIDAPRVPGLPVNSYPDNGCNTEIYTNPGTNAPYVELECLGPLFQLPVGSRKEFSTTYTLFQRSEAEAEAEARKILQSAAGDTRR